MRITEQDHWDEAIKEAKELIEKSSWSKSIRFLMALRNEIQRKLDEYNKNLEKK